MNLKTIKKKVFRTPVAAWLFFVLSAFSLLFIFQTAEAVTGDYNKPTTGTLAASEWNNLLNDFVAKSGSRMDGNFSINTATSSGYALDISGILRASHFSGSLGAADVSTGVFGQNTGGGDFNFLGNVGIGIGTSSPNSIITIANDHWISALNNAGTGYVNLFKVNANDELEIGGALNVGQFQFAEDSGFNTFVDMPVSATPSNGTIEGYTMKVDGDNILTVYSEANGTGGVQNKRVGIGTSTPAYTLDVAGIINASALYVGGSPYIGSQWVTNGTNVYYNTGSVGIGISNPSAKLEVSGGNILINDALITSGTPKAAITKEYLDSALASTTAGIITQVATSSFWQGSLAGNVYNANTGNVGIGTTAPGAKLDVVSSASSMGLNIRSTSGQIQFYPYTSTANYIESTNAAGTASRLLYFTGYSGTTGTFAFNGNVGIGTTNPGAKLELSVGNVDGINIKSSNSGFIRLFGGGTTTNWGLSNDYNSGNYFEILSGSLTANPTTRRLAINGINGDVIIPGNVGIGITSPLYPLHIVGNSSSPIRMMLQNTGSGQASLDLLNNSQNTRIITTTGKPFYIYDQTSTKELLTIISGGNVGIGTTTPSTALSISGGNAFINDAAITSGTPKAAITKEYLDSSLSAFNTETNLWKLNGSNLYASSTAWNLGIGTTNPGSKLVLDLDGTGKTLSFTEWAGAGTYSTYGWGIVGSIDKLKVPSTVYFGDSSFYFQKSGLNGLFAVYDNFDIQTYNGSYGSRLRVSKNGNVGIGTTAPVKKLEVFGDIALSNGGKIGQGNGWGTNGNTYNATLELYSGSTGYTTLQSATAYGLLLNPAGGNVGIGTTTIGARLSVSGGNAFINDAAITSGTPKAAITKEYLDSSLSAFNTETNLWKLNGSNLYASSTAWNLGVGTTDPQAKLNIKASVTPGVGYNNLRLETGVCTAGSCDNGILFWWNTINGARIAAKSHSSPSWATSLVFETESGSPYTLQERMRINYDGNVGIGTTNPTTKLHVENGVIRANNIVAVGSSAGHPTGIGSYIELYMLGDVARILPYDGASYKDLAIGDWNSGNPNIMLKVGGKVGIGIGAPANQLSVAGGADFSGNVGIGTTTPLTALSISGGNAFINDAAITSGTPKAAITKEYLDSSLSAFNTESNLWKLNGSNVYSSSTAWNVGIGTTNPTVKFQVNGDQVYFNLATSTAVTGLTINSTLRMGTSDNYAWIQSHNSKPLVLNSLGNNVGIGTTNPLSAFHVYSGGVSINKGSAVSSGSTLTVGRNDAFAHGAIIRATNHSDTTYPIFFARGSSGTGNGIYHFLGENSSDVRVFSTDYSGNAYFAGNVGIGTTTPSSKLSISGGNAFINDAAITSGTPKAAITKEYLDSSLSAFNTETNLWKLNGSNLYASSTSWNLGVGTTNPVTSLDIVSANNVTPLQIKSTGITGSGAILRAKNGNDVEVLTLLGSGNLGLGETVPDERLTINGNIRLMNTNRLYFDTTGSNKSNWIGTTNDYWMTIYNARGSSSRIDLATNDIRFSFNSDVGNMILKSNGNVGIGTTNPSLSKLQVVNTLDGEQPSTLALVNQGYGVGTGNIIQFYTAIGGANKVAQIRSSVAGNNNGDLMFDTANGTSFANVMTLKGSGNVGIGTTTPSTALSISGGNAFINDAAITSGTPKAAITKEYLDSSLSAFNTESNLWKLNGSNVYSSSTAWNVGIGTTNPSKKFEVAGDVLITTTSSSQPFKSYQATYQNFSVDYLSSPSIYTTQINFGLLGRLQYDGNGGVMNIENRSTQSGSSMRFVMGTTERLRITDTGNVGIGIVSPNSRLHLYNSSVNAEMDLQSVVGAGNHWGLYNNLSDNSFRVWGGSDYLTILRNGNIGIGTTAPTQPLTVKTRTGAPYTALEIQSYSTFPQSLFAGAVSNTGLFFGSGYYYNNNYYRTPGTESSIIRFESGNFKVFTDAGLTANTDFIPTERMRITSTGNIGINTTNPGAYRLNVNGDTNITGNLNVTGTSTATNFVGPITGTISARNVSTGAFGADTGGGDYSFSGNLGIGTTNPTRLLDIKNDTAATINLSKQDGDQYLRFTGSGGGTQLIQSSYRLGFDTAGVRRMTIDYTNGNVGIGTTNPGAKLEITGATLGRNFRIADTGVATFNFSDNAGNTPFISFVQATGYAAVTSNLNWWSSAITGGTSYQSAALRVGHEQDWTTTAGTRDSYFSIFTSLDSALSEKLRINSVGNVGIGTTDPGVYKLKVAGDVAVTGTLQTQTGSDFAEEFSVTEDLSAGTVVVMANGGHKAVTASSQAYDRTVVGIVSDNPSIIAGRIDSEKKVIVAMMGVVSVKVNSSNGKIKKGDLLTTSDVSGYAMKATDFQPGTIIGKALEDLHAKTGYIKVLVNLQ